MPAEALPPLAEDEFYLHDLVGLSVEDEEGVARGTIAEVMDLPMHRVLVVRSQDGTDTLVPDVPAFVVSLDVAAGRLVVRSEDGTRRTVTAGEVHLGTAATAA